VILIMATTNQVVVIGHQHVSMWAARRRSIGRRRKRAISGAWTDDYAAWNTIADHHIGMAISRSLDDGSQTATGRATFLRLVQISP